MKTYWTIVKDGDSYNVDAFGIALAEKKAGAAVYEITEVVFTIGLTVVEVKAMTRL